MPSAMFLKENHDNTKTFKIDMKVLMDNAVSAKQVCYLSRQWLSSQFFGSHPPQLPAEGWGGRARCSTVSLR